MFWITAFQIYPLICEKEKQRSSNEFNVLSVDGFIDAKLKRTVYANMKIYPYL